MERQRKELQGPRPTPLKVSKDSHKIKKPPQQHPLPPRPPVITYTVSPKIIHTSPTGFMSLVQRLTGSDSTTSPTEVSEETEIPLEIDEADTCGFDMLQSILSPGAAGLLRPLPGKAFSPVSDPSPLASLFHQHDLLQQDYVNSFLHQIQYDDVDGEGGGGISGSMMMPSPSATTAFHSPNPMLSPASIEFLSRLLDQ